MISVRATLRNGKIKLLEPVRINGERDVIVTVLDQPATPPARPSFDGLNKLIGTVHSRSNGSTQHDRYVSSRENL